MCMFMNEVAHISFPQLRIIQQKQTNNKSFTHPSPLALTQHTHTYGLSIITLMLMKYKLYLSGEDEE